MPIQPLAEVVMDRVVATLPKADLHIHHEEVARLDRVIARQRGRSPHDWRASARRLLAETPPGDERLLAMYAPDAQLDVAGIHADAPETIIAKLLDLFESAAADGAVLVEVRLGVGGVAFKHPDFMTLFRTHRYDEFDLFCEKH